MEVNLYSREDGPYEIYVSFGDMFGIIYVDRKNEEYLRSSIKAELEEEYKKNKKPTNEFVNHFANKYDLRFPF